MEELLSEMNWEAFKELEDEELWETIKDQASRKFEGVGDSWLIEDRMTMVTSEERWYGLAFERNVLDITLLWRCWCPLALLSYLGSVDVEQDRHR